MHHNTPHAGVHRKPNHSSTFNTATVIVTVMASCASYGVVTVLTIVVAPECKDGIEAVSWRFVDGSVYTGCRAAYALSRLQPSAL